MGRNNSDRNVHIDYTPELMEVWESQTQALKDFCNTIAEEQGYTGQNVFYLAVLQYLIVKYGEGEFLPYQKKE